MRYLFGILILVSFIISGCGSSTPTPDVDATIAAGIAATQAAQPTDTPTPEPTNTPEPTETPIPTDTPTPTNTPEPTDTSTPIPTDTPTPEPMPVSFSDSGSTVKLFTVESGGGLALFSAQHQGNSNFIVWLLDGSGNQLELLVNEVGNYEGDGALSLMPGKYALDVDADGVWAITLTVPGEVVTTDGTVGEVASLPTATATFTPAPVIPTNTPVPPTPLPKTNDLGVAKTVGNWQMSLYDVKRAKTVYFFGDPKTAQGVWLIPFVEFTNLSPGTLAPYDDLDFYLQREDGSTISVGYNDGTAGAAWQFQAGDFLDDIQPGQLIGVALAEDVSQDLSDVWLRVEQDPNFAIYLGNASSIPLEE